MFDHNGVMLTGWALSGGNWYYLYPSGNMAYDVTIDGFTLGSNGVIVDSFFHEGNKQSIDQFISLRNENLPEENISATYRNNDNEVYFYVNNVELIGKGSDGIITGKSEYYGFLGEVGQIIGAFNGFENDASDLINSH